MSKRLIRFDWAIKNILRSKDGFPILEGFLSELLGTEVTIKSLLESESNKENEDDKSNRVDIIAELSQHEKVIIEIQYLRQWDFLSRMLYGVSKVVVEHLKAGDPYGKIPRVISVNIVYFNLGQGKDYIYHGTTQFKGIHQKDILLLDNKERAHYPDHIDHLSNIFPEYYVLKVDQFDLKIKDTLDEWIYALKQSEVKPEFSAKGIQDAARKLDVLQLSKAERARYDEEVGSVRDFQSYFETYYGDGLSDGLQQGLQEGLQQGIQQGIQQGAQQLLVRQLQRRFPHDLTEKALDLISKADSKTLAQWGENLITAEKMEGVFVIRG